jgi:plasmid stabilization system protein ParE
MVKRLRWNKQAISKMDSIVDYLNDEVSFQAAMDFVRSVNALIEDIKKHPSRGRKVKNMKTMLFINLKKHHQLFYRLEGSTLVITAIFDTRQNPDKRPY